MAKSPIRLFVNGLLICVAMGCVAVVAIFANITVAIAQEPPWQTYTSDDAAYSVDYPPNSILNVSQDVGLRFKTLYIQFPVTDTEDYQGASILVLENPAKKDIGGVIESRYTEAGASAPATLRRATTLSVNGVSALRLERDPIAGDHDKYSVFLTNNSDNTIAYRINLFGSGVAGDTEPSPQTLAIFDRLLKSFKLLNTAIKPKTILKLQPAAVSAEPPVATVFTYPLRSTASVGYGVPTGIVQGGTRMEWLDYGIRNFDQWHLKCYGVDWSRMIHTGEDWYRNDYLTANTAGSPVYAVADGVVVRNGAGISYPGNVVLIRHRLANGRDIYSMYGHVTSVLVVQGQIVSRGQQIASVFNQGYTGRATRLHPSWDSHMHFEMRYFMDGTNIYVPSTNAYGYNYPSCTYAYPGRGYTYIIHPDVYPYPDSGYVDASDFIATHQSGDGGGNVCTPLSLISNGNFESGRTVWTAVNSANANDPLIYTTRPRTGRWSGWLGNRLNYVDTLSQQINIPASSTTLTLKFWRYVQSKEAAGNGDDRMTITLKAPDGSVIGTQGLVNSAVTRSVWRQEIMQFNVTGLNISSATLSFSGNNDADLVSSFFIDDITFVRDCPPAIASAVSASAAIAAPLAEGEPITATETPTVTVTETPSPTPTITETAIATPTETATITPTTTPTTTTEMTPTATATGTATVTGTVVASSPAAYMPLLFSDVLPDDANAPEKLVAAPVCSNLVVNGDFEASPALPWTGIANTNGTIYNVIPGASGSSLNDPLVYSTRARSGTRSGRVGSASVNGYWNELVQTVKLPSGVTSVTLTYWRFIDSADSTTAANDTFSVGLETDKGIEIVTPQRISNASAGRGSWVQQTLTLPNAAAYSGQSLWISFKGRTSASAPTSLYLDDVQLITCATP